MKRNHSGMEGDYKDAPLNGLTPGLLETQDTRIAKGSLVYTQNDKYKI